MAISSITEIFGTPKQPHYAASKAALGALVRSLAVDLARHDIQLNAIQPGWIVTDATAAALEHAPLNDAILRRTAARRWGRPEDFEGIAVYLASDTSRFHTGDSIRIDGGYSVFQTRRSPRAGEAERPGPHEHWPRSPQMASRSHTTGRRGRGTRLAS